RGQRLELAQVLAVQRIGAADGEGHAVQRDRVALRHLVEDVEGAAARVHEVLGEGLEPVHLRPGGEDVAEVDGAQAYAQAEVRKVPAIAHRLRGAIRETAFPSPYVGRDGVGVDE